MVPTIFLQTFVIGVCVAGFVTVVVLNQLSRSRLERLGIGIVIVGVAYFAATALQKASTSQVVPPLASNPAMKASSPSPPSKQTEATSQPAASPKSETMGEPEVVSLPVTGAPSEPVASPEPKQPCRGLCAEVLYDGPTAAGGVINPRDIMAKELSDTGFEILVGGAASLMSMPESTPSAPTQTVQEHPRQHDRVITGSPSGLTVKEIFEYVRKSQQGELIEAPAPASHFQFLPTLLFAATPPKGILAIVAMRASMRHLNENQGIFSTEANMQIAAVTSEGRRIQRLVLMAGPETVRGFGLDWERAEEASLKDILAKMCPAFAKDLQGKLAGEQ